MWFFFFIELTFFIYLWRTGVEVAERFTYVGFGGNLVTYLTNVLHESTATAVKNVNIWVGASTLLPLFGAFITDSYSGRYHTILFSSLIYVLVSNFRATTISLTFYLYCNQCVTLSFIYIIVVIIISLVLSHQSVGCKIK